MKGNGQYFSLKELSKKYRYYVHSVTTQQSSAAPCPSSGEGKKTRGFATVDRCPGNKEVIFQGYIMVRLHLSIYFIFNLIQSHFGLISRGEQWQRK